MAFGGRPELLVWAALVSVLYLGLAIERYNGPGGNLTHASSTLSFLCSCNPVQGGSYLTVLAVVSLHTYDSFLRQ